MRIKWVVVILQVLASYIISWTIRALCIFNITFKEGNRTVKTWKIDRAKHYIQTTKIVRRSSVDVHFPSTTTPSSTTPSSSPPRSTSLRIRCEIANYNLSTRIGSRNLIWIHFSIGFRCEGKVRPMRFLKKRDVNDAHPPVGWAWRSRSSFLPPLCTLCSMEYRLTDNFWPSAARPLNLFTALMACSRFS